MFRLKSKKFIELEASGQPLSNFETKKGFSVMVFFKCVLGGFFAVLQLVSKIVFGAKC